MTFIPTILWILEWIVYLWNTKEEFDIKYNYDYIKKQKELWYEDKKPLLEKLKLKTDKDKLEFVVWLAFVIIIMIILMV